MRLVSRLVVGGLAGLVGTMAMTSAMRRLHARLPAGERYPLTPREIVDEAGGPGGPASSDLTLVAHFAYGAACGALLAVAGERPGRAAGAAAGAAIWVASYMGWVPALGLLTPATEHPARRNALMIGVHLVWGASTAAAMKELADAHGTIFAGGPDRDAAEG